MAADLAALAQAVSGYVGNGSIVYLTAPKQAVRIALTADRLPFPVLMTNALSPGSVLAVAANGLATSVEAPVVDAAKSVAVVEDDTSPPPIGTAAQTRSMWQTDSVALRVKMWVTWTVRDARAVAYVAAATW
jgi:hypothetical protein